MKRDLYETLVKWKNKRERKPLLLLGARQVGKSWLVKNLGTEFDCFIELNFEENTLLNTFFEDDLDPKQLIIKLSNYFGEAIVPGKTLLFFDEIQLCQRAIVSLRYFYEKMPELHVIGAGSLLEFELENVSFPVGRIEFLYLYPLSFGEFLNARGLEHLRKLSIEEYEIKLPKPIHYKLQEELRNYTFVGGMPEVVSNFIQNENIKLCREIQSNILNTFIRDFGKYTKKQQIKYVRAVFESIPHQLGNKFMYSQVSTHYKARDLKGALELLEMAGIAKCVYHTSASGVPLGSHVNYSKFKVLFFDIGLAQRVLKTDIKSLLVNPDIMQINKGAIAELYVGLHLLMFEKSNEYPKLFYWHRESKSSMAEVDYVWENKAQIVPIEVKSGSQGKLYSLREFIKEKNFSNKNFQAIRFCQNFPEKINEILSLPLYSIEGLMKQNEA